MSRASSISPASTACAPLSISSTPPDSTASTRASSPSSSPSRSLCWPPVLNSSDPIDGPAASGITPFRHPNRDSATLFRALEAANVVASLRFRPPPAIQYIRLSPHFYNTLDEIARVVEILLKA